MIVSDVNDTTLKEMDACVADGVTSFKMFMAYPGVFYATDGEILLAMQQAARNGAMIMMHAENGIAIDQLVAQALAAGRHRPGVPRRSPARRSWRARPRRRAITLAKVAGVPAVHRAPVGRAGPGRGRRRPATPGRTSSPRPARSTCTCRSTTWPGRTSRAPSTSARRRCAPGTTGAALWRGLRTNDLSVVSTDHCPFCFKDRRNSGRGDFSKIPNGMPGVEHRMDLLHQGVVAGRDHAAALGGGQLDDAGPDVRPVPAQGGRSRPARTPTS